MAAPQAMLAAQAIGTLLGVLLTPLAFAMFWQTGLVRMHTVWPFFFTTYKRYRSSDCNTLFGVRQNACRVQACLVGELNCCRADIHCHCRWAYPQVPTPTRLPTFTEAWLSSGLTAFRHWASEYGILVFRVCLYFNRRRWLRAVSASKICLLPAVNDSLAWESLPCLTAQQ